MSTVLKRQAVSVTYKISPAPQPPHIVLTPGALTFYAARNGPLPSPQTFTISNSGEGTLNWTVSDGATWLAEAPTSGNSNSEVITVSISTTDLPVDTHYATITVTSTNADNSPKTLLVTYIVQ